MGIQISGVDNAEEARAIVPGTDTSTYRTYHDGLKARADRAHARLKSIGVQTEKRGT